METNEPQHDTFVSDEDKQKLLNHLKQLYSTKFEWADDTLIKALIKHHYNETIKQIDKVAYLKDKSSMSLNDYLEQI